MRYWSLTTVEPAAGIRRPLQARASRRRFLAAAGAPAALLAAGCAYGKPSGYRYISTNMEAAPKPAGESGPAAAVAPEPTPAVQTYAAAGPAVRQVDHLELPLRLSIPRLSVNALVVAVGLTPEGAMDVPQRPEDVGWYQYSARPGMKGNAVLAGHLTWYGVDGVFRRLVEMKPGDTALIQAADGQQREYGVAWHEEWPLNTAPVGKVFEPLDVPALTLITCGGRWNAATQRFDTRVVIRAER
jgi:sortase (surface protein transpeptidase)